MVKMLFASALLLACCSCGDGDDSVDENSSDPNLNKEWACPEDGRHYEIVHEANTGKTMCMVYEPAIRK